MLINNRLFFDNGSSVVDLSATVNDIFSSGIVANLISGSKLYIGSDFPFNHRYFEFSVVNAAEATLAAVEIWDGSSWVPAVDVTDETKASGKTFAQNGIISWVTDRNKTWGREASTELMENSGLQNQKVYDMYWVRLTFSAALTSTLSFKYMGHKFSKDSDLGGRYADLTKTAILTAFKAGKTNWNEQACIAAEEIIRDLRKGLRVVSGNQVFGWQEFSDASVHKVAEIIFSAFGTDYENRRDDARELYSQAIEKVIDTVIDKNADGRVERDEKLPAYGRLVRM